MGSKVSSNITGFFLTLRSSGAILHYYNYVETSGAWARSGLVDTEPDAVSTQFTLTGNHKSAQLKISNLDEQSEESRIQYLLELQLLNYLKLNYL